MGVLKGVEPQEVFKYFEEISNVPRGSGNMKPIGDYCEAFAKARNLEYYRDELDDVIIIKEATKGYENSPAMIIQGHLDIVCEKTAESKIDFLKDGLELAVDGDLLYAKGTTLGGDNGIAIAMALAVLDSDKLEHPRIEAVFTVDEETGLYGAEAVDVSMLKAKKFLNMDSEDEGIITVSCAGGTTAVCELPVTRKQVEGTKLKIVITGLQGGHSGMEIDKGRGNADKLMGRLLYSLSKDIEVSIIEIAGGSKDNAIPKEAVAELVVTKEQVSKAEALIKQCEEELKNECKTSDPGVMIVLEKSENITAKAMDKESTARLIFLLLNLADGVQTMSADIKGLVETSLNLGILKSEESRVGIVTSVRSSVDTASAAVCDKIVSMVEFVGGTVQFEGSYPGWEYKKDSQLRDTVARVYKEQTGQEPIIEAIHAGLECGMFSEKITDLDCVSIGPTMTGVHTVDERLSISSVERTWKLLVGILKESK